MRAISRLPSKVIANRWNCGRGIDPGFLGCDCSRAAGQPLIKCWKRSVSKSKIRIAIWGVTVLELSGGIAHADAPQRRVRQQQFLDDLFARMPVHPVTAVIALRAGSADPVMQLACNLMALDDLLIGSTALELGYSVASSNVRHFAKLPDLVVEQL